VSREARERKARNASATATPFNVKSRFRCRAVRPRSGLADHALIPAHIEQASDVTGSLVDVARND